MFNELNNIEKKNKIYKKDLIEILQNLAKAISVHDLMNATAILREEGKYIQPSYRDKYLETYINYFIMRIKDVKEDKTNYNNEIDNKKNFQGAIELLESQFKKKELYKNKNDKFPLIYTIICLYTTFILNEAIHPIGTLFPGNLKVVYQNKTYLCPVKDKQSENPNGVCLFCIAEQLEI